MMTLDELLHLMIDKEASDLHLKVGRPPGLRIHGELIPLMEAAPISSDEMRLMIDMIITGSPQTMLDVGIELDFSYSIPRLARFRVNIFWQRKNTGIVIRAIPIKILTLEELAFPPVLTELALT